MVLLAARQIASSELKTSTNQINDQLLGALLENFNAKFKRFTKMNEGIILNIIQHVFCIAFTVFGVNQFRKTI